MWLRYLFLNDSSELVHVGCIVTLALAKHVHVVLAVTDFTSVGLEALDQSLVKAHAWVLHGGHLLVSTLAVGLRLSVLLGSGLHLLLLGRLGGTMAAATAHHCANTLVSDF